MLISFLTKVVSPSDRTTLTSGEGYDHKEIVSGTKHKFLFMLENFKVINAGFSFFVNNIFSITQKFYLIDTFSIPTLLIYTIYVTVSGLTQAYRKLIEAFDRKTAIIFDPATLNFQIGQRITSNSNKSL